jgi:hypothetical protein
MCMWLCNTLERLEDRRETELVYAVWEHECTIDMERLTISECACACGCATR